MIHDWRQEMIMLFIRDSLLHGFLWDTTEELFSTGERYFRYNLGVPANWRAHLGGAYSITKRPSMDEIACTALRFHRLTTRELLFHFSSWVSALIVLISSFSSYIRGRPWLGPDISASPGVPPCSPAHRSAPVGSLWEWKRRGKGDGEIRERRGEDGGRELTVKRIFYVTNFVQISSDFPITMYLFSSPFPPLGRVRHPHLQFFAFFHNHDGSWHQNTLYWTDESIDCSLVQSVLAERWEK